MRALLLSLLPLTWCAGEQPVFAPAQECSLCHTHIPAPDGTKGLAAEIGQYALWKGSAMSHAARDPYWEARRRFEVAHVAPEKRAAIEAKCTRCHAPAAAVRNDGVTCTICHQIQPGNLGTPASFSGGFVFGTKKQIFGPHPDPFTMPMEHHTEFLPVEGKHMLDSALCATCHTVLVGDFLEQAPFLEWKASAYAAGGRSCQSCHMPRPVNARGEEQPQYIAHRPPGGWFPPTSPRKPFGQHAFAGANVALLDAAGEMDGAARAAANLRQAAELRITARRDGPNVETSVEIRNLAGHKLPTAYPSRRMWLHLTARGASGRVLFESGAPDRMPATQPHHRRITRPEDVQIYEAEQEDAGGRITTSLVAAARYWKDNRILPAGFDAANGARVRPVGVAGDADFQAGQDTVVYAFPAPPGEVRIEARLHYQSAKPAHLEGLAGAGLDRMTRVTGMTRAEARLR